MPIYEYSCKKCGTQFEVMQVISAKPLKNCKIVGCKGKVERLMSASGFILKGSGWYATDYPSESRKKGWEADQKASTGTSNKGEDGHNCGTGCNHGDSVKSSEAPAPASAKPNRTPPKSKNPYSGGKRKSQKAAKTS